MSYAQVVIRMWHDSLYFELFSEVTMSMTSRYSQLYRPIRNIRVTETVSTLNCKILPKQRFSEFISRPDFFESLSRKISDKR